LERPAALQERVFKRLFDQAEIAQFTPEERREYAESVKDYWDYYSTMQTAHKKGKAEGLAEGEAKGRAEGRAEEKKENARRMKADGMTADLIAKYTGLTVDEIESL
jgi:predicted transposase/invertase (TIGR01784 family)